MSLRNNIKLDVVVNKYTVNNGPFCLKVMTNNLSNDVIKNYELVIVFNKNIEVNSFLFNPGKGNIYLYSIYYSVCSNKKKFIPFMNGIKGNVKINLVNLNKKKIYCFKIVSPYYNISSNSSLLLFRGNVLSSKQLLFKTYIKENYNIIKYKEENIYVKDIFTIDINLEKFNVNKEYFYYKLSILGTKGIVKNPCVGILLPLNLIKYFKNEEKYEIVDLINNTSFFNLDNEFDKNILPVVTFIHNFNNTSRILVKFNFNNYILSPDCVLNVYIKVKAKGDAYVYCFNKNLFLEKI